MKTILSLFDHSGAWSKPYKENGYDVLQIDLKLGYNILEWDYTTIMAVYGILAAPPCTDFATSGSQYWEEKDRSGRTELSVKLVKITLKIVQYFDPVFWVIENPAGRIDKLIPELKDHRMMSFNPCDYGDPYTKYTILWGKFNPFLIQNPVTPVPASENHIMKLGGSSEKTKEIRSITPEGFAIAFFNANK